jgi:hypothetical protein
MVEGLPTTTYKKTQDIPMDMVVNTYNSSKNVTQASKLLASRTGFSDRGIRYFLRKMEVRGLLDPSRLTKPSLKHIESVNKERAEHGVAPSVLPKPPPKRLPPKKQEQVMLTVHLRVESNGLGRVGKGISPIYFEASYSKIVDVDKMSYEIQYMKDFLEQRILGTENYDRLAGHIYEDESQFMMGVESESLDETHHRDGEVIIPLKPRRFK